MKDYRKQVELAMSTRREGLLPTVEKEILHYGILEYLQQEKYLKDIVFMGGTSLRLCHGSSRYSEDLDFSAGKNFNPFLLENITLGLENHVKNIYGLNVRVKPPKSFKNDNLSQQPRQGLVVDTWVVSVETNPGKKHIARQIVKIEFANVPAYDVEIRKTLANYAEVNHGTNMLMYVSSKNEILADKIKALSSSERFRNRDVWDITWLSEKRATVDHELVATKFQDYGIAREMALEMLKNRIATLGEKIRDEEFTNEMTRFLDQDQLDNIADENYLRYMETIVKEHLSFVHARLSKQTFFLGNTGNGINSNGSEIIIPKAAAVRGHIEQLQKEQNNSNTLENTVTKTKKNDFKP